MVRPDNAKHVQQPPPRFNVTRVVVVSAIIFLLFLLGAWLLVDRDGRRMMPRINRPEAPHARWSVPAHGSRSLLHQV
jgi:hypothetical protein